MKYVYCMKSCLHSRKPSKQVSDVWVALQSLPGTCSSAKVHCPCAGNRGLCSTIPTPVPAMNWGNPNTRSYQDRQFDYLMTGNYDSNVEKFMPITNFQTACPYAYPTPYLSQHSRAGCKSYILCKCLQNTNSPYAYEPALHAPHVGHPLGMPFGMLQLGLLKCSTAICILHTQHHTFRVRS